MAIIRIGVGDTLPKKEGYVNADIRDLPNIDIICDARVIPVPDGTYDGLESRNLVEHFGRHEIGDLFKEWARILKPGGTFSIETVDMGTLMDNWRNIPVENLLDGILGAQTYPENFHKMAFTQELLVARLEEAGLTVTDGLVFIHREIPRMIVKGIK